MTRVLVEAVGPAAKIRPDVILMDIRMPGVNGIEATERILAQAPDRAPRILILADLEIAHAVARSAMSVRK
jgi:DNA-binding NarL/FixJ family response regulator